MATIQQRNDSTGSSPPRESPTFTEAASSHPQVGKTTQSDNSLSRASPGEDSEDGRFSISEEVNLDQQSEMARHVGQMPQDTSDELSGEVPTSDSMGKATQARRKQEMRQDPQQMPDTKDDEELKNAINRAVPPL